MVFMYQDGTCHDGSRTEIFTFRNRDIPSKRCTSLKTASFLCTSVHLYLSLPAYGRKVSCKLAWPMTEVQKSDSFKCSKQAHPFLCVTEHISECRLCSQAAWTHSYLSSNPSIALWPWSRYILLCYFAGK